jgi:nicotinamidase-related amidase
VRRSMMISLLAVAMPALAALGAEAPPATAAKGKPALVVMDIQNAFMPYMDGEETEGALPMINATIDLFRKRGLPVIRVYHTEPGHGPEPGTVGFEFPETVRIQDSDPVVVKNHPSAFTQTELDRILREQGVDTVFLSGLSAVGCVLATYFDADRLDYRVFMVRGGLISHKSELTESVEEMTGAVGYEAIAYMLAGATD